MKRNDVVRILKEKEVVRQLQKGHGPWNNAVEKVGPIIFMHFM